MTNWVTKRMLPLSGVLALLLGLIVATVGIILYGSGMTTNLLAGSADLLIGIAIAILVVDRINRSNLRRQWTAAYQALHGLLAATFVDVMRLFYVQSSPGAWAANASRYEDAIDLATLHVGSLRSTIEGFSATLDPDDYATCRKVEQRLAWMVSRLSKLSSIGVMDRGALELMAATSATLAEFIEKEKDQRYVAAARTAEDALDQCGFRGIATSDLVPDEIWHYRFACQNYILEQNEFPLSSQRTIMDDIDNELAIYYFALDRSLLESLTAK